MNQCFLFSLIRGALVQYSAPYYNNAISTFLSGFGVMGDRFDLIIPLSNIRGGSADGF
jgi:hypothetical protein